MTERASPGNGDGPSEQRPWWNGGADGLPDVEAILGPEGMQAVGGVAEEALKLFVVLRDRAADTVASAADARGTVPGGGEGLQGTAGGWGALLGQLASGAVQAVTEFAAAAGPGEHGPAPSDQGPSDSAAVSGQVKPGDAAACAYCPICQAIALFRAVPTGTWQRLAGTIVEVAETFGDEQRGSSARTVHVTAEGVAAPGGDPVGEFFATLQSPPQDD
jgi:hypothetical protein